MEEEEELNTLINYYTTVIDCNNYTIERLKKEIEELKR